MSRRSALLAFSFIVLVALAGVVFQFQSASNQGGSASATNTPTKISGFYLDIGASASLGFQPTGIVGHNGHRTNLGYANDVLNHEASRGVTFRLRQIGCPGETVQSMLGHLKDACYTLPNTQLTIATKYLHANEQSVGLVTIEMGFNNIRPCMLVPVFVPACAAQGITYVRDELPLIVRQLKAAAGPHVHFVGLEYADPFLASYLDGSTGRVNANENLAAFNQLNAVLQSVYSAAGIPIANVPGAFYSADATLVNLANVGLVPKNVFEACSFSWMCTKPPFGPDDHPNNAGYRIIANTIIPKLPKQW